MLEIKNVHKTFNPNTINEKKALRGIDLVLNEGDFVTVIGGNGAGKSTMLNMIAGVYPVDCGTITVDGIDVTKLPEHKRAKYIGRVFQDPMNGTAADMQILENLALAKRRGNHRRTSWKQLWWMWICRLFRTCRCNRCRGSRNWRMSGRRCSGCGKDW